MLRAINVSGQRKITMLDLKKLICSLGFKNIESYLRTGNIILSSDLSSPELNQQLSSAIEAEFG
jgi:uncharacterized protein (DUF1697 family)